MFKQNYHYPLIGLMLIAGIFVYKKLRSAPAVPVFKTTLIDSAGRAVPFQSVHTQDFVVVGFVQSWCRDCVTELPSIAALQDSVGRNRLQVVLISDESPEKLALIRKMAGSRMRVLYSEKKFKDLGIEVFPTTYLIGKNGKVLLSKMEGYHWDSPEVINLMQ